jgi:hypothetical protein
VISPIASSVTAGASPAASIAAASALISPICTSVSWNSPRQSCSRLRSAITFAYAAGSCSGAKNSRAYRSSLARLRRSCRFSAGESGVIAAPRLATRAKVVLVRSMASSPAVSPWDRTERERPFLAGADASWPAATSLARHWLVSPVNLAERSPRASARNSLRRRCSR